MTAHNKPEDKPSRILSELFKKVQEENNPNIDPSKKIDPTSHYVKGAHTQGVYHKQYNRY
jgi:hypothetical protein